MYYNVKGVREYNREESELREWMRDTIKDVYRRYGFSPYEPACLLHKKVLEAKGVESQAGEIFYIKDGDYGLRFDLTAPFAHYVSNHPQPKPIKRYWIGKVWRREEPQHLRLREFWQADVDIVGDSSVMAEVELLLLADDVFKSLGLSLEVVINHRQLVVNAVKDAVKDVVNVLRVLDKWDKVGEQGVRQLLSNIGEPEVVVDIVKALQPNGDVAQVLDTVKEYGVNVVFSPTLVRGQDYYTGTVFEFKVRGVERSVGGGGRYDNLLGIYGFGAPAVGFGIGLDRLWHVLSKEKKRDGVAVVVVNADYARWALDKAQALRRRGVRTLLLTKPPKNFVSYVKERGFKYLLVIGRQEYETGLFNLRNLEDDSVKQLDWSSVLTLLTQ